MIIPGISRKPVDLTKVTIEPLDPKTDRAAFCCGNKTIDNFCKINAKGQHKRNQVRVYDAHYEGRLIGYYYLLAGSDVAANISDEAAKKFERAKVAPSVYLGMIGVCEEYQGSGVGPMLFTHAMQITVEVADRIGVYALTLHADNDKLARKYKEQLGFEFFLEGERAMYIAIGTLRDAINPAAKPATG